MHTSPEGAPRGLSVSSRYTILRKLGTGSIGTVYLARDEAAGRQVALKIIRAEHLGARGLEHLQREFRSIASLCHPQIAAAFDFGYTRDGNLPFYTRESIDGEPLAPGPPGPAGQASPREFLAPFFDLLDALHYLHAHEILHLDIHAGNLIVARDPRRGSVLIDFGLLRSFRGLGSSMLIKAGSFLPPEVLTDRHAGAATDLYSVGRLLLYRLTGSPDGEPRLPREIPGWGPRLTLDLERIAARALQGDPRRRFQSAAGFRDALSAVLGEDRRAEPFEPGELTLGRDEEIEAIEEALRQAAAGTPAILWFTGPRGIGKTRLLGEARWRAQVRGLEVADARFFPEQPAEAALFRTLRHARGSRRASSWLTPLAADHGGTTADRARRAAHSYFAEEGSPLAVLLDDLEHADRESRLLAEALLLEAAERRSRGLAGRGLALMIASRGRPSGPLAAAGRAGSIRVLKPLGASKARELLRILIRPLTAADAAVARFARETRGLPRALRQAARALHSMWGASGAVPPDARLESPRGEKPGAIPRPGRTGDRAADLVIRTLLILQRPAGRDEIAAAAGLAPRTVDRVLRRLEEDEAIERHRQGRPVLFRLSGAESEDALRQIPDREARRVHRRMLRFLRRSPRSGASRLEHLARHLLLAGRLAEGRAAALRAAGELRRASRSQNALRLLGLAVRFEEDPLRLLRLAEEISSIHEEAGDHREGIAALGPAFRKARRALDPRTEVRILRRLGVHSHRSGQAEGALRLFEEARELADPRRDAEELVFIDSELAELHTLRANYPLAAEACQRGIELLKRTAARGRSGKAHLLRMEVTLRASQGLLELRRLRLEAARKELEAAARLSRTWGTSAGRALILNNLGIVHNQRNQFSKARRRFAEAKRILIRSGERRGIVQIASNLALIDAKTGDAAGARSHLEQAAQIVLQVPDPRLEFLVGQTRGTVSLFLGDMAAAVGSLQQALPLGRRLGDVHLVRFGEVFLAEALMACGQYGDALRQLRLSARAATGSDPPLLLRLVHGRLVLLELLLGRPRGAEASRRVLESTPRTGFSFLEAWNDLFIAKARDLAGGDGAPTCREAKGVFRRLGIPAGRRLAAAGLLEHALAVEDPSALRAALGELETDGPPHRVLSVLEPLAAAEAHLKLGEADRARASIEEAAGAMIGLPFLELDWRIELLRARLAEREADREGARKFLHRCLHIRALIARSVPAKLRARFESHPRFATIEELAGRLERPGSPVPATGAPRSPGHFGIIGRSKAMAGVLRAVDGLRDQELPVLITGETGTGKELVARAIHQSGPRRQGDFFALHCASLPSELFESELFGYLPGAFTGAEKAHPGILERLARGTLFLDEVSGLSPATQAKFLRVLESRSVRPLGGYSPRPIDVRFIASSSLDLEKAVKFGTFRADLFFRLRGVGIDLPPLRSRKGDIPLLADHFLDRLSKTHARSRPFLDREAMEALEEHDWPGNVRELETILTRLVLGATPRSTIGVESVRSALPPREEHALFGDEVLAGRDLKDLKNELEKAYLIRLFRETGGDIDAMARSLGKKRISLYVWFHRVGIDVRALRRSL
jgi:DNA-binding NtrC family response regulator/tetratricopeptide (TPR) repeat protein